MVCNQNYNYGGTPKGWMVYGIVENPIKMDENWGYPYFRKPPCVKNKSSNRAMVSIAEMTG